MVNQQRLQALYEKGRQSGFKLPKSVTVKKEYSYEGCLIPSKVFPCPECNEVIAMILFDNNATTQSELEDHVRLMYSKVKELNVPTWVVGKEIEIESPDGIKYGKAISMKVWPNREEVKYIDSNEFNHMIDIYINSHCSRTVTI